MHHHVNADNRHTLDLFLPIDYTAQELASTLNVTIRSANRILLKWMDAELVDIVGEEKLSHKGRPRRIYRLSFIEEEQR